MMAIVSVLAGACLIIGLAFNALGVIGILRFPDVYTRLHADTKATTFGSIFTSLGVVIFALGRWVAGDNGMFEMASHTAIAVFVLAFTNAVGAHAIARAARRSGIKPNPVAVDAMEPGRPGGEP